MWVDTRFSFDHGARTNGGISDFRTQELEKRYAQSLQAYFGERVVEGEETSTKFRVTVRVPF
jgi:hypothetical protein